MTEDKNAMPRDIRERTFQFALRTIWLCQHLDKGQGVNWTVSKQLLRAGTSIGANVEEGQAAQSRPDFVNKINIALKECRETCYWLRLIAAAELVPQVMLADLLSEAEEIGRVLGPIIVSTKKVLKANPAVAGSLFFFNF